MVAASDISPSKGENVDSLVSQTTALVDSGRWNLCDNGKGLERKFKFRTFKATWVITRSRSMFTMILLLTWYPQDFMNMVAAECKKQKHHPEWTNVFNKTHIRWTTHNPEGLSAKDTAMAKFCDEAGREFGEAEPEDEVASCYGPGKTQT